MKREKILLCLFFAALLLLTACGGAAEKEDAPAPTAEVTPEPLPEGLCVEGVSAGEYTIIADDVFGWDAAGLAAELRGGISAACGREPALLTDEEGETEREIVLCSDGVNRELPFERGEALWTVRDGKVWIYGPTEAELRFAVRAFTEANLNGDSVNLTEGMSETELVPWNETVLSLNEGESLADALESARELMAEAGEESPVSVVVDLGEGSFALPDGADVSGSELARLTLRGQGSDKTVIEGVTALDWAAFTPVDGTAYYSLQLEADEEGNYPEFRNLYVNGARAPIASTDVFPASLDYQVLDTEHGKQYYVYLNCDALTPGSGGENMELCIYVQWENVRLTVTGLDWDDVRETKKESRVRANLDPDQIEAVFRLRHTELSLSTGGYFYTNHPDLLTPGSFCYDPDSGTLLYMPREGETVETIGYSDVDALLRFEGMRGLSVEGIAFTGTTCTQAVREGFISFQASQDKRYGVPQCAAVLLDGCENVSVADCSFTGLGGFGLLSQNRVCGLSVTDCVFQDVAMSAVAIGNRIVAGWDEEDSAYAVTLDRCAMESIAFDFPSAPAVYIDHCDGLKITHNSISDTAYTAISLGWNWTSVDYAYGEKINLRHAEVAWNDIRNYVRELQDGGAIYVLGGNCETGYTELFNFMHDNYAEREADDRLIMAYYLDGASSNWLLEDNVSIGTKAGVYFQGFDPQTTYNDHCYRFYTDVKPNNARTVEKRNIILEDIFIGKSREELFQSYPEAKAIMEAAGREAAE